MSNRVAFERFEVGDSFEVDGVFRYFHAVDQKEGRRPIVLATLTDRWRTNEPLVSEMIECFERLQALRRPELVRVLSLVRDQTDGLGIALEPPGDRTLPETGAPPPMNVVAQAVCEALHAAHNKGVFHGRLRAADLWVTGETLRLSGFGYVPAIRHGWRPFAGQVAPEMTAGVTPDPRIDVYALARLLKELYPAAAQSAAVRDALDPSPDRRPRKMRDFMAALEAVPASGGGSGVRVRDPGVAPRDAEPSTGSVRVKDQGAAPRVVDDPRRAAPVRNEPPPPEARRTEPPPVAERPRFDKGTPAPSATPPGTPEGPPGGDQGGDLRHIVSARVFDSYCDQRTEKEMVREAVEKLRLDRTEAQIVVEMELEQLGVANERKLLRELDAQLHLFTDADKKLDPKEKADTVEYVCRARPGYARGLSHQVAESYITEFCRTNGVRVKAGLFGWKVP